MERKDVFDKIFKNPFTLVKGFENLDIYLSKEKNLKIFSVKNTITEVMLSYENSKNKKNSGYFLENDYKYNNKKEIVYLTGETMKNFLVDSIAEKKESYDFCSAIIIDKFDSDKIINTIIINLWIKMYKVSKSRPYLILLTRLDMIPHLPFKLDDKNTINVKKKEKNIGIIYNDKNYKLSDKNLYSDMFQKIKELHQVNPVPKEDFSTWVIFTSDKYYSKKFSTMIYNFFKNTCDVFNINTNTNYKKILNIIKISKKGCRKFLIFEDNIEIPNCIKNVNGIIDSMTTNYLIKSEIINTYTTKYKTNTRINCLDNGFYLKMCTENFYDTLAESDLNETCRIYMEKIYLDIIKNNLDPVNLFISRISKNNIQNSLDKLEKSMLLVKKDNSQLEITDLGNFVSKLPFSIKQNMVIKEWIDSGEDIFQIIVLTSIVDVNKSLLYRNKDKNKDKNKDNFESGDTLNYILQMLMFFIKKTNILTVKENEIKDISKENNLNYKTIFDILEKIKLMYNVLSKNYEIYVNQFNQKLFLEKCIPIYEKVYINESYRLIDADKKIYSNGFNNICTLDIDKFYNPSFITPSKIIPLLYTKLNTSKDSVQRRKNMISLFLTSC